MPQHFLFVYSFIRISLTILQNYKILENLHMNSEQFVPLENSARSTYFISFYNECRYLYAFIEVVLFLFLYIEISVTIGNRTWKEVIGNLLIFKSNGNTDLLNLNKPNLVCKWCEKHKLHINSNSYKNILENIWGKFSFICCLHRNRVFFF